MKRPLAITILSGVTLIALSGTTAMAASTTTGKTKSSTLTQVQQTDLDNLKTKGNAEISRRLTDLNSADKSITDTTKLSSSDQTYLENEVTSEVTGLSNLQTTLAGETTLSAARTDVQSIFSEYRVYALVLPKVRLVSGADAELSTDSKLSTLQSQIQTQITADQNAGKNVSAVQADLTTMESKTSAAQSTASSLETNVLPLQPTNYDSDHTILSGDLAQLETAHSDNVAAAQEGKTIVNALKSL